MVRFVTRAERHQARLGTFKRWTQTLAIRGCAIAIVGFAIQFAFNSDTRARYEFLRGEVERMDGLNEELMAENEQLRLQIDGIVHDDRYLEQIARQEFAMIRKGEVLFKFPQPEPADDSPARP
ncbi:MAG: cell division protein FtsB [Myxococcota bacterium]|jgi:cell division protein FtsB